MASVNNLRYSVCDPEGNIVYFFKVAVEELQGKLQQSKLVRLSSSSSQLKVWCADNLLLAEASQSTVRKSAHTDVTCH